MSTERTPEIIERDVLAKRVEELESKYKACSECRDNAIIERNALAK